METASVQADSAEDGNGVRVYMDISEQETNRAQLYHDLRQMVLRHQGPFSGPQRRPSPHQYTEIPILCGPHVLLGTGPTNP